MDKDIILKDKRDEACDDTHWPWLIRFQIEYNIFEYRVVFIYIFDAINLDDDIYERGSGVVRIRLNVNVKVTVKNWVLAIWSVRADCECTQSIICEQLDGSESCACNAFSSIAEMRLIFPHAFQEDLNVHAMCNMFYSVVVTRVMVDVNSSDLMYAKTCCQMFLGTWTEEQHVQVVKNIVILW